jgi:hypothetical protein
VGGHGPVPEAQVLHEQQGHHQGPPRVFDGPAHPMGLGPAPVLPAGPALGLPHGLDRGHGLPQETVLLFLAHLLVDSVPGNLHPIPFPRRPHHQGAYLIYWTQPVSGERSLPYVTDYMLFDEGEATHWALKRMGI